jgi:ribosomal protein S4E
MKAHFEPPSGTTSGGAMPTKTPGVRDGARCRVIGGTHKGKSGVIRDIKTSKTGHVTITVVQATGVRFKTLARNVVVQSPAG